MLANIKRGLLLATSNRSEAAVGYTTMDGDTCGGISPIAGIDKAFLRRWLKWVETVGPVGAESIPALVKVNEQQPTAELRPPEENQTDESDLMPYEILDLIERLAIRDKQMPQEILDTLIDHPVVGQFTADRPQVIEWIKRFFFSYGRVISGNVNGLRLPSTSTTRIWIPKPGVDSRFSLEHFDANWQP